MKVGIKDSYRRVNFLKMKKHMSLKIAWWQYLEGLTVLHCNLEKGLHLAQGKFL